ncbi:lytic transglycosylase domain-containing protein [Paraherbaspirillum soli]|uniref:Lytic transglycosylase domain-containing protein n=1 Tax=Paraherbaspirillum soli TaxID=631222 RepID=A0ABW0M766_9BURK
MNISAGMQACRVILAVALWLQAAHAVACWRQAATSYGVNPDLLYAIAKTESSLNPRAINRNKDGSYDIGLMQINSRWFPQLEKYGVDREQLYDPCVSIQVGAWILAQNMRRLGNSWNAVGAYNSGNPVLRMKYAMRVYRNIPPAALAPVPLEIIGGKR